MTNSNNVAKLTARLARTEALRTERAALRCELAANTPALPRPALPRGHFEPTDPTVGIHDAPERRERTLT